VKRQILFPTVLYVAGLIVLYTLLPFGGERWWLSGVVGIAAVAALIPFVVRRLTRLQVSDRPIPDALQALAVSATMLVLGFSALFESMAHHSNNFAGLTGKVDAVYFSVTTLSTVGYGDIHAVSSTARLVVTLQIIFNLLFLGGVFRIIATVGRERHRSLRGSTVVQQVIDEDEPLNAAVDEDPSPGPD